MNSINIQQIQPLAMIRQPGQALATMQYVAEQVAQHLLRAFREAHPWWQDDYVLLDELAEWLDVNIEIFHADSRPDGTYGYVDPDEDEHLIWLRHNLFPSIRRFTLAHELGHVVLHCRHTHRLAMLLADLAPLIDIVHSAQTPPVTEDDTCRKEDVDDDSAEYEEQDRLGIGQSYDPRSLREQTANMFAAELLMPLERVRTLYLDPHVNPSRLSEHFGVSSSALLNRLVNLLQPVPVTVQSTPTPTGAPAQQPSPQTAHRTYDEFQQAAITASTPALIIAGPGSGKTSTLIGRVEYLVESLRVPPQHILALTFSRKAAEEMQERLQALLPDALPKVCTFHAFCADLLRRYGEHVGLHSDFTLLDEAESYKLLQQQSHALQLRHYQRLQAPTAFFPDLLKAISRAKDELSTPEHYAQVAEIMLQQAGDNEELREQAERATEVAHVYSLYQQALTLRGDTDFGGLLMLTLQLFREQPSILREQQGQYQHILVDEFQDVNRASGVLLRELAGVERRVWVVGDTNQAIYRFRGASPANMTRFTQDFPGAVILPLSRNYRSRPDLVKVAESFRCRQLELGEEPGKNEATRLTLNETSITLAHATDEASELQGIAHDIRERLAQGYTYRDMVILCRTRVHAQKISQALIAMGFPITKQHGLLEQAHIKDALSVLLLLTDATGSGLLRLTQEYALSHNDLEALFREAYIRHTPSIMFLHAGEAPLSMSIEGRHMLLSLSALLERLQACSTPWQLLSHYLFIETMTIRNILQDKNYQERLADYDALLQLARHFDTQYERTMNKTSPPSLYERAKEFLDYLRLLRLLKQEGATRRSEQNQGNEEQAANMLRVMTVHASKGLEFPIVYLPGLVTQRFPATRHANPVPLPPDLAHVSDYVQQTKERLQESEKQAHESGESCLFYVGVTRARDVLVLSYSDRYGKKSYKPSSYLDSLRAGLSEERVNKVQWKFDADISLSEDDEESLTAQPAAGITDQLSEDFISAVSSTTLRSGDIEAYHRCPRQYAYTRLYHFGGEQSGYQLFHQATRRAIEELNRLQNQEMAEKGPGEVDVQALYRQHWQALGGHDLPFAPLYEQHGEHVLSMMHRASGTKTQQETWSSRYDVEIAGHPVQVTVDRVEMQAETEPSFRQPALTAQSPHSKDYEEAAHEQSSIHTAPSHNGSTPSEMPPVATFKRTRFGKRKEKPDAEMRDLFYTLAYRQQYPGQKVNLQHHNLSTGETTSLSMTPKKEQKLQEEVEHALEGIVQHHYPAKPAEASECLSCPFSFICPI